MIVIASEKPKGAHIPIAHPSPLAGPFRTMGHKPATPGELEMHEDWLRESLGMERAPLLEAWGKLRDGTRLACPCRVGRGQGPCHGDTIARVWGEMNAQQERLFR